MGIETKSATIGGHTYKITTFGARQGMIVAMTLIRFLGPTMAEALGGSKEIRKAIKDGLAGLEGGLDGAEGLKAAKDVKEAATATTAAAKGQDLKGVDEALGDMLMKGIQTFATTATDKDFNILVEAFVGKCVLVQPLVTKVEGQTQDIQLTLDTFDRTSPDDTRI
jgi:hypothetical protein